MFQPSESEVPPLEVVNTEFSKTHPILVEEKIFQKPPPITPNSHEIDFLSLCLISLNEQNNILVRIKRKFHFAPRAKRFLGDFFECFPTLYKSIEL